MAFCRRLWMLAVAESVEAPSGAVWFIRYLTAAFSDATRFPDSESAAVVTGQVPGERPKRFVMVETAGGSQLTPVTFAVRLLVSSWETTTPKAERLAARVDALARAAPGHTVDGVYCRKFEAAGLPYDMPDPDAKVPRFRQNIILHFRGQLL